MSKNKNNKQQKIKDEIETPTTDVKIEPENTVETVPTVYVEPIATVTIDNDTNDEFNAIPDKTIKTDDEILDEQMSDFPEEETEFALEQEIINGE